MKRGLNFITNLIGTILKTILWFLIYKKLTMGDLGTLTTITQFSTYISLFIGLELHRYINRRVIKSKNSNQGLFLKVRAFISITLLVITILFLNIIFESIYIKVSIIIVFLYYYSEYLSVEFTRYLNVENKFIYASLVNNLVNVLCLVFVFIFSQKALQVIVLIFCIAGIVKVVLLGTYTGKVTNILSRHEGKFDFRYLKGLIALSNSFIVLSGINIILYFFDRFVIEQYYNLEFLGTYNLYFQLISIVILFYESYFIQSDFGILIEKLSIDIKEKMSISILIFTIIVVVLFILLGSHFGEYLFQLIDKGDYFSKELISIFGLLGLSKILISLSFYKMYANKLEKTYVRASYLFLFIYASIIIFLTKFVEVSFVAFVVSSTSFYLLFGSFLFFISRLNLNKYIIEYETDLR